MKETREVDNPDYRSRPRLFGRLRQLGRKTTLIKTKPCYGQLSRCASFPSWGLENYVVLPAEHLTDRKISLHMTFQSTMPETLKTMKVHLKCLKTDLFKEGTDIFLVRMNDELCPVAAMLPWLILRGKEDGLLFQFQSGAPLTCSCFILCLKGL